MKAELEEIMTSITAKAYSVLEEWLNSISHGVGFIAAIVGMVFLLYRADNTLTITAGAIYGATLILMFLSSTLYHATSHHRAKGWLKLFDHSAIYLLIAGTYHWAYLPVVCCATRGGFVVTGRGWFVL